MNKEERLKALEQESISGVNAIEEFKTLNGAFVAIKADIMDSFENKETLDIEELQEVHRTYRNLAKIEDFFLLEIKRGQEAQTKLNAKQRGK